MFGLPFLETSRLRHFIVFLTCTFVWADYTGWTYTVKKPVVAENHSHITYYPGGGEQGGIHWTGSFDDADADDNEEPETR